MLAVQERLQDAELRRTADLLRLTVAALGGVILVVGLLLTGGPEIGVSELIGFTAGVFALVGAAFLLSRTLAGPLGAFAYGPDMALLVDRRHAELSGGMALVETLVEAMPGWLADNQMVLDAIQRRRSSALVAMVAGVTAVLGTLLYIAGGAILG